MVCRNDRNRHGGGIIAYISERYNFKTLGADQIPLLNQCLSEFLPIVFTDYPVVLVCVYHPFWNSNVRDSQCLDVISSIIDFAVMSSHFDFEQFSIIACGDFNGFQKNYDEISAHTQLKPVVHFPTRGVNTLDQIFVNFSCEIKAVVSPPLGSSDHSLVFWKPSLCSKPVTRKIKIRKFSTAAKVRFANLISGTDWMAALRSFKDLDACTSFLSTSLYYFFDLCFPIRTVRMRSNDPPWLKPSLKVLIDDRDRAFSKKQIAKYCRLRKEVNFHIRVLKKRYLDSAISSNDSKSIWHSLRVVARDNRHGSAQFSVHDLNAFFCSNFQSCTDFLSFPVLPDDLPQINPLITRYEVSKYLRKLKNKSPGVDGLPPWVLRDFSEILAPAVSFIFNWSLKEKRFPASFKFANVTPVPKCTRPSCVSDFRPISLLSVLSKVFERIVCQKWILPRLAAYADKSQFAYMPGSGRGTTTALTLMQHEILEFLDSSSGAVRLLSIDFAKAFDKIPHSGIIEACIKFRLPMQITLLIKSFLSDRHQRVKERDLFSAWMPVRSGVPQGSVIGPLLFCMFIDEIKCVCDNSTIIKYADDITILHRIRTHTDDNLQSEFDNVANWSNKRCLPINFLKCKVLDIITKKTLQTSPVSISTDVSIPSVSTMTLLGITLSADLKWNSHIYNIIKKASRRVFIIRNLKKADCPSSTLLNAYSSLIRSICLYAYPSFCNIPVYLQCKLLRLERRVLRIIGVPHDEVSQTVIDAGISLCERLFTKVVSEPGHPLRRCFEQRTSKTRSTKILKPVKAKTSRLSASFTRFGR